VADSVRAPDRNCRENVAVLATAPPRLWFDKAGLRRAIAVCGRPDATSAGPIGGLAVLATADSHVSRNPAGQQSDSLSLCDQLLCHFQRDQAAERESDEDIRSAMLYLPDGFERVSGHVFDTIQRLLNPIDALGLHAMNRARRLDVLHDLEKIHDAAAQSVGNENRRLRGAIVFRKIRIGQGLARREEERKTLLYLRDRMTVWAVLASSAEVIFEYEPPDYAATIHVVADHAGTSASIPVQVHPPPTCDCTPKITACILTVYTSSEVPT
jgi:hypothetical protein